MPGDIEGHAFGPGIARGRSPGGDRCFPDADDHHVIYQRGHDRAGIRFFADSDRVRQHGRYFGRGSFDSRRERHRQK